MNIDYKLSVNKAREFNRKNDYKNYLTALTLSKTRSDTWALCWAYIRWVDDKIDSNDSKKNKFTFLRKQKELLESIELQDPRKLNFHEKWLYFYLINDKRHSFNSLQDFKKVFESFELDLKRRSKILTTREYYGLLNKKSVYSYRIMFKTTFSNLINLMNIDKIAHNLGMAHQLMNDTCDIFHDLEIDQINITKEEINRFNINIKKVISDHEISQSLIKHRIILIKSFLDGVVNKTKKQDFITRRIVKKILEYICNKHVLLNGSIIKTEGPYLFLDKLLPKNENLAYFLGTAIVNSISFFSLYKNYWF